MTSKASLHAHALSYSHPDGTPLFSGLNFTLNHRLSGLVGRNGCGKSTLFRLLMEELTPDAGQIHRHGTLGYLPQQGLPPGAPLSGGEQTLQALKALRGQQHAVLLLDEPTNHLDASGRTWVYRFLEEFDGMAWVISHDRELLDRMDAIWELSPSGLLLHGGNFTSYWNERQRRESRALQIFDNEKAGVRKEARDLASAVARQQKRMATGKRHGIQSGMPRVMRGGLKRKAQATYGKVKELHEERLETARVRLDKARAELPDFQAARLDLPATVVRPGQQVLRLERFNIQLPGGAAPLWKVPLNFHLTGPRRVALSGSNGAGKTTLLRAILRTIREDPAYPAVTATGVLQLSPGMSAGYLDQRLELLDRLDEEGRTLVQALRLVAPRLQEFERRIRLGRLLFAQEDADKPLSALSGGERARAALLFVLCAEPAPRLLLLDEPTNHLDFQTIGAIESALRGYRGAMLVVSHDSRFLEALGIEERVELERLTERP